jgi:hypothetical protein
VTDRLRRYLPFLVVLAVAAGIWLGVVLFEALGG